MAKKNLYVFEMCEAVKADGTRCEAEATTYVRNEGAYMPYQVCGNHRRSGEALVARGDGIPNTWGRYGSLS